MFQIGDKVRLRDPDGYPIFADTPFGNYMITPQEQISEVRKHPGEATVVNIRDNDVLMVRFDGDAHTCAYFPERFMLVSEIDMSGLEELI